MHLGLSIIESHTSDEKYKPSYVHRVTDEIHSGSIRQSQIIQIQMNRIENTCLVKKAYKCFNLFFDIFESPLGWVQLGLIFSIHLFLYCTMVYKIFVITVSTIKEVNQRSLYASLRELPNQIVISCLSTKQWRVNGPFTCSIFDN